MHERKISQEQSLKLHGPDLLFMYIYVRGKINGRELHPRDDALHLFKVHEKAQLNLAQRKGMSTLHNGMPNCYMNGPQNNFISCFISLYEPPPLPSPSTPPLPSPSPSPPPPLPLNPPLPSPSTPPLPALHTCLTASSIYPNQYRLIFNGVLWQS